MFHMNKLSMNNETNKLLFPVDFCIISLEAFPPKTPGYPVLDCFS